ncbi:MAG: M28 family peptidase [Dehalococcoidia bacterium]
MEPSRTVAFFDIGETLAAVKVAPAGDRIELTPYPHVLPVLHELLDRDVRLGVISDPGPIPPEAVDRALDSAGLRTCFEPALVVYGPKDSSRIFQQAAARAGTPDRLLFVGEDPLERADALGAGFRVAPHPALALAILEHEAVLRYVRVQVPPEHADAEWQAALAGVALLPLYVAGERGTTVYAIATSGAAAHLDDLGFLVDRLGAPDEPLTSDLYLLRDDRQVASGFLAGDGNSAYFFDAGPVLASTSEGLLVAVSAGASVESYHFRGARHGHNRKLRPFAVALPRIAADRTGLVHGVSAAAALDPTARKILDATIRAEDIAHIVDRYSGARPVGTGDVVIASRHIHHEGNAAAVTALVDDLGRIGTGRFTVGRHRFIHEGRSLDNAEAELPGRGLDGLVLVTAHLDSTGARDFGYRPDTDPAPGADDDASGVAGVLAAAAAILALDSTLAVPRRAVRFVLFNAEEHGLVGSHAYASDQAAVDAPIVAVLQLDMIGYDVRPHRTFELHAGFRSWPAVQARSLALARTIAQLVPQVSPALPRPQLYPAPGELDPAEERSDHYSFQLQGYPACLASEDLFAGPGPGAPEEEMNPQYHLPTETTINAEYAADIVRVVTAAAWLVATR